MRWLDSITESRDMTEQTPGDSERQKKPGLLQSMGCRVGCNIANEQQELATKQMLCAFFIKAKILF